MRRMPPCVVVSSPPDDLRCYIYEGGKDSLDVYYSSLSINYRRDTSIKSGTISKLIRELWWARRGITAVKLYSQTHTVPPITMADVLFRV